MVIDHQRQHRTKHRIAKIESGICLTMDDKECMANKTAAVE